MVYRLYAHAFRAESTTTSMLFVYRGGLLYGQALLWLWTAWTQFLMRLAGPQWSAVHGRSGRGTSGRLSLDRGLCGGSAQQACCRALRRGVLCSVEAANVGEHVH